MARAPLTTGTPDSGDGVLTDLRREPFRLRVPPEQTTPFIFASPHSGRAYPRSFVSQSRLSFNALRRSEDAFVEELFLAVVGLGAPLIAASFPRAYLDVNRAPQEFDSAMFEGPLPFAVDAASPRVSAGLGVIPRIVREGAEIYRQKLAADEASDRLAVFYRPYHAALAQLADETKARFGSAVVIDCHSMPSAAAVPDIVLGDRYGVSAASVLIRAAESAFESQGFSVARNVPYAGGYTTQLHGRPGRGSHALQIEINRALYMDEDTIRPAPSFAAFAARLMASLRSLMSLDVSLLAPRGLRHAAE
jgi:N-formylglutamate amidohydrolase